MASLMCLLMSLFAIEGALALPDEQLQVWGSHRLLLRKKKLEIHARVDWVAGPT
jgi:hypothetical protein